MRSTRCTRKRNGGPLLAAAAMTALGLTALSWQGAAAQEFVLRLTASSANVDYAGRPVRIDLLRWSSEEERAAIAAAGAPPAAAAAAGGGAGDGQAGGRGAGRAGGRGPGGFGGGGGGGGGGRGGGGGAAEPEQTTPVEAVADLLQQAPTLGYIWTDSSAGHSIRHAERSALPGGGERIILATRARLDEHTGDWTPTGSAEPTGYEFTLIELRLDADGTGEGRSSLTTEVALEDATGALALTDYAAAPVILDNVSR